MEFYRHRKWYFCCVPTLQLYRICMKYIIFTCLRVLGRLLPLYKEWKILLFMIECNRFCAREEKWYHFYTNYFSTVYKLTAFKHSHLIVLVLQQRILNIAFLNLGAGDHIIHALECIPICSFHTALNLGVGWHYGIMLWLIVNIPGAEANQRVAVALLWSTV